MPSDTFTTNLQPDISDTIQTRPAWGAVFSMSLGVFSLVTAEFLPASLLTPLAEGLDISKGGRRTGRNRHRACSAFDQFGHFGCGTRH